MKQLFVIFSLMACSAFFAPQITQAQVYKTKTGIIAFYSESPLENITAVNSTVRAAVNAGTGDVQFSALMKAFEFEKALMQEHFNENYVESDKFPKSTFKGSITNLSDINFSQDGSYDANVSGSLTLHGVTQAISTSGKIIITNGQPQVECTFTILLSDYGISIPAVVKNNISNIIGISIIAPLQLQQAIK